MNVESVRRFPLLRLYYHALRENMPSHQLSRSFKVSDNKMIVDGIEIPIPRKVDILAFGKAARVMYERGRKIVGRQCFGRGLLVTHEDNYQLSLSDNEKILRSSHPLISTRSEIAGLEARIFVEQCHPEDILLVLVSGGGSAMVALPIDQITLADKIAFISEVMHASVPEREVNVLKKALSQIKGGKLAELCNASVIVNCIVSDERHHDITAISSGMTVCNPRINPVEIMDNYDLWGLANKNIEQALRDHGERIGLGCNQNIVSAVVGSREDLINGMRSLSGQYGYSSVLILDTLHSISPDEAVNSLSAQYMEHYERVEFGRHLIIATGEVQVKVKNAQAGRGGRNQHLVGIFMLRFKVIFDFVFAAVATDGMDYAEGVHGAFFSSDMKEALQNNEAFVDEALRLRRSRDIHEKFGGLIRGPKTGTNMSDFFLFSFDKVGTA